MAQHKTFKNTPDGKQQTAARRARRHQKYGAPGLDLDRLAAEIRREQAAMDRANSTTLYR